MSNEYGHHIDYSLGKKLGRKTFSNNEKFIKEFEKDFEFVIDKIGGKNKILRTYTDIFRDNHNFGGFCDIMDAMVNGALFDAARTRKLPCSGHGSKYYIRPIRKLDKQGILRPTRKREPDWEIKTAETFAQLFRAWAGNKEEWEIIKEFYPNITKYFKNLIKELLNDS